MTEAKRRIQDTEQQESTQTRKQAPKESLKDGRTRRAFLAHLRHELRTLINAIIGYSEMLMEDASDLGQEDFISDLENIHSAGSQLLELVNDTLSPAKIEAALTERELEALGAQLCHGLRTRLNNIIGFSEMLLEDAEGREQGDFIGDLRKIHSAAERFLVFISDIVNLSRIDAKDVELDLDTFDASSMVRDVMASLRPLREDEAGVVAADRGSLLVVDDNEMNRDLLSRHLERQGHTVMVAENGRQALEIIKTRTFDLVLLDIMMPEINGCQLLHRLKRHDTWRDIPVIMISALDEMDTVVRCIEMGAEDYLLKPFDPVLLRARINACLERKRLRIISKYVIKHTLGQGGLNKFRNEAKIIAQMSHKNIIQVYDIEELYRTIFIILEYLEGESVESMLERIGSISIPQAVNFLTQICSGLGYAHEKGLVHLDIKPANIFVQADDEIKILDFGLARPPDLEEGSMFEGTIYYLAPEQIECDPVDQRTDIYSLGITAYEMIVGKRPYPEDNLPALLKMHLNQDIPDPAELVPDLPEGLRMFILKACQRDPNQRYQNIGEVLEDLRRLASDLGQESREITSKIRKMTILNLIYSEEKQMDLNRLMEQFSAEAKNSGIDIKASEFKNI
jgi:DNA-binding response OmpR family regulator